MADLPRGTVTFLFTDIEGSTRLLHHLGATYRGVLLRHDQLVRQACSDHGGHELATQGNSFCYAFRSANDAVAAAVDVQRALASEPWADGARVRVRIGLDTGEPVVSGDGYVGLSIHRAARICAAGHGGQIVVSGATHELLEHDLDGRGSFRDLGRRHLKDFDRPERLFQVTGRDLPMTSRR